jgi:hypothetical protein
MPLLLEDNNSRLCNTDASNRHLCLDAVPQTGMLITSLDLDFPREKDENGINSLWFFRRNGLL